MGDLQEGRNYTVTMYAYNDRGRSRLQRLQVATLTAPAETGEMSEYLRTVRYNMLPDDRDACDTVPPFVCGIPT